jgi:hypothetical protein
MNSDRKLLRTRIIFPFSNMSRDSMNSDQKLDGSYRVQELYFRGAASSKVGRRLEVFTEAFSSIICLCRQARCHVYDDGHVFQVPDETSGGVVWDSGDAQDIEAFTSDTECARSHAFPQREASCSCSHVAFV